MTKIELIICFGTLCLSLSLTNLHQNNTTQYITTCSILDLCLAADHWTGARVEWRWWNQGGLDLEVVRSEAKETYVELEMDMEVDAKKQRGEAKMGNKMGY